MRPSSIVSHHFRSRRPDLIHHYLTEAYGTRGMRIRGGGGFRLSHRRLNAGSFRVDRVAQSGDLRIDVEQLDSVVVCQNTRSVVSRISEGELHSFRPGDVFLNAHPGRPYRLRWRCGEVLLIQLDPGLLQQVVSPAPGRRLAPVRFTDLQPASPVLAEHWRLTARYVRLAVLGNPEAGRQPLVLATAARTLAAAALAVFPNTAATDPTPQDRRDASAPALRRAIAFMEENAHRDISPADVAVAAAVSVRSLQLAFRRHLDSTPAAYLRRIRLERAHQELRMSDPRRETVSGIATRWGFLSHSRFTAHYRSVFGIPPSRTLHG
ncbi:helix-turn-helix transcriptional regulator [Micromonospora sp. C28ISP2-4]|uniref:helix-turn-helix transcriptional regulator n=1 Tax=Micromonospora sp. C28ISP2-4 TaxID=3059523 RepID=UPI0026763C34|nr:helix-turn-helix transcriptional regulator [Micromonospora sp. C28ISP2-4]MDO3686714.1 helix-turn-helix transcriptional regulator [Micromonospora sp. C28ISP2-4]